MVVPLACREGTWQSPWPRYVLLFFKFSPMFLGLIIDDVIMMEHFLTLEWKIQRELMKMYQWNQYKDTELLAQATRDNRADKATYFNLVKSLAFIQYLACCAGKQQQLLSGQRWWHCLAAAEALPLLLQQLCQPELAANASHCQVSCSIWILNFLRNS